MKAGKIEVRVAETDKMMEVGVFSKRADKIEVVLGEGIHPDLFTLIVLQIFQYCIAPNSKRLYLVGNKI